MELDEKTGLPKLPKWHYFHFKKDFDGDVRCELRKGLPYPFSSVVHSTYCYPSEFNKEKMSSMATTLYERFDKDRLCSALLGSYPPKSIK